jgi:hypothetical protein
LQHVARRATGVYCINWLNECQSRICAVRGRPLGFVAPEGRFYDPDNPPQDGNFFVDTGCRELARQATAFEREVREMKDRAG